MYNIPLSSLLSSSFIIDQSSFFSLLIFLAASFTDKMRVYRIRDINSRVYKIKSTYVSRNHLMH